MATLPTMIAIPAGIVELRDARAGADGKAPARSVELQPFEIGRTPVTRAEYDAILAPASAGSAEASLPAHPVTWFDAVRWCNLASDAAGLDRAYLVDGRRVRWDVSAPGFRLPTEAEWEWSCRAGSTGPRYGRLPAIAWSAADELVGAQPVAGKRNAQRCERRQP